MAGSPILPSGGHKTTCTTLPLWGRMIIDYRQASLVELAWSGGKLEPEDLHQQCHIHVCFLLLLLPNSFLAICFLLINKQDIQPTNTQMLDQIDSVKQKLLQLSPSQLTLQLDTISQILEGSATVFNLQLSYQVQSTCGRPKEALNKPKSTTWDSSEFNHIDKKRKLEEKANEKNKKEEEKEKKEEESTSQKRFHQTTGRT
jgi:hypothetical protein